MVCRGFASADSKCICKYTFNCLKTWNKNDPLNASHTQPWQVEDNVGDLTWPSATHWGGRAIEFLLLRPLDWRAPGTVKCGVKPRDCLCSLLCQNKDLGWHCVTLTSHTHEWVLQAELSIPKRWLQDFVWIRGPYWLSMNVFIIKKWYKFEFIN